MRVCLLVHSPVADDPRVRRHGEALHQAGWDVHAVGHVGGQSAMPGWRITELPHQSLSGIGRVIFGARSASTRFLPATADATFWSDERNQAMYRAANDGPYDVYVANDWDTLPIAARLADEHGGRYVYDSHEYWTQTGAHIRKWRYAVYPLIAAVESAYIGGAAGVITVSEGIADQLVVDYSLRARPAVIRNLPPASSPAFVATTPEISLLYHGVVSPARRIEEILALAPLLPDSWTVTVRGPAITPAYAEQCEQIAARAPGRAVLEPPVLASELVPAATTADIGIVILNGSTPDTEYALPNKLFEYFAAGLAVVVSDHSEQADVVREHSAGWVVDRTWGPQQISEVLNGLSPEAIDTAKRGAIAAAQELNWTAESSRFTDTISTFAG